MTTGYPAYLENITLRNCYKAGIASWRSVCGFASVSSRKQYCINLWRASYDRISSFPVEYMPMSNLSLVTFAADKMETSMRLTDSACAGSARQVNNPLVGLEDINKYTDNMIGLEVRKGLEVVKLLGQGVSRAGFETSHGTVIKIPKTANGARENILESYLLSAMLPTMRTTPIICRHRLFGMPVLEVEKLDELSNNPGDRKAVAGSQYKELALVARKGFGLTDWLQIGFSKRFNRWVLNDVAPPWGAANKQADPLDLKWALHRDVCDEQEHYNCKGV